MGMPRELNKNEFFRVMRAYKAAEELYENGYYKEVLFELKAAFRLLERDGMQTRILAKAKILQAKAQEKLARKKQAALSLQAAVFTLERIGDTTDLMQEAKDLLQSLQSASS